MKKSEIRKLDKEFLLWLRKTRKVCERCGETDDKKLQTSHHYSRSHVRIRWNPLNVCLLCARCHFWWTKNPIDGVRWLQEHLSFKFSTLMMLKETAQEHKTMDEVRRLWKNWEAYSS